MLNIKNGLNFQMQEKLETRRKNKNLNSIYAKMMKDKDQMDIFKEQQERQRMKIEREKFLSSKY